MMRKVGNRSLKSKPKTESLFVKPIGHHTRTRPPSAIQYQAIKVPIAALRDSSQVGVDPVGARALYHISSCGKAARSAFSAKAETPWQRPKSRLFPQQSAAGLVGAIKAASIAGNISKESGAPPQPCRRPKR